MTIITLYIIIVALSTTLILREIGHRRARRALVAHALKRMEQHFNK